MDFRLEVSRVLPSLLTVSCGAIIECRWQLGRRAPSPARGDARRQRGTNAKQLLELGEKTAKRTHKEREQKKKSEDDEEQERERLVSFFGVSQKV